MKKKELARLRAYDDEQRDRPQPAKKPKVKKPYIVQCRITNISGAVESQFPWVKEWSRGQAFRSMEEAEKFKKRQERTQKHYKWCRMEYRIVDTTQPAEETPDA